VSRITRREFATRVARAGGLALVYGAVPSWIGVGEVAAQTARPSPADLIERNEWPEHWETTVGALGRSLLTPNSAFFVRSHFAVPDVDPADYRLEVTGLVHKPLSLSLADLRTRTRTEAVCTLECAGNGRGLFALHNTSGTQWQHGAVGTASWGGVLLASLLESAGVKPEAKHVWFEAADHSTLPSVPPFLRSIPLDRAMSETLLADTMNGEPLPKLHGAPVRVVVPGWYGMASTKWVTRIRVEGAPSDNHFMIRGYRYVKPGGSPLESPPVEEIRVKSLITRPLEGERVAVGRPLAVSGFAWAGSAGVQSVEISSDQGASWQAATLTGPSHRGAWRQWSASVPVSRPGSITLLARATDGTGVAQPLVATPNGSGYGNNSQHRVVVHAQG
jgi:DMSO/TMAO reductase YedYZ molybdopterin-dependent catalytic subunit